MSIKIAFLNRLLGTAVNVSTNDPLPVTPGAPTPGTSTKATFVRGYKAPAATATPEALAAAGTYVQNVVIFALRTGRVANAASVWIDSLGTNDAQAIELAPGATYTFTAPPGKVLDLADIFVDAGTLTDGVFFLGQL